MKKKRPAQTEGDEPHHQLYEAISLIKGADEAKHFLLDLCTPAELQTMADRWLVVDPIKQGSPYRKIYDDTGVSVTTIGRVARSINEGNDGYNTIYERLKKRTHVTNTTAQNRDTKKREAQ